MKTRTARIAARLILAVALAYISWLEVRGHNYLNFVVIDVIFAVNSYYFFKLIYSKS